MSGASSGSSGSGEAESSTTTTDDDVKFVSDVTTILETTHGQLIRKLEELHQEGRNVATRRHVWNGLSLGAASICGVVGGSRDSMVARVLAVVLGVGTVLGGVSNRAFENTLSELNARIVREKALLYMNKPPVIQSAPVVPPAPVEPIKPVEPNKSSESTESGKKQDDGPVVETSEPVAGDDQPKTKAPSPHTPTDPPPTPRPPPRRNLVVSPPSTRKRGPTTPQAKSRLVTPNTTPRPKSQGATPRATAHAVTSPRLEPHSGLVKLPVPRSAKKRLTHKEFEPDPALTTLPSPVPPIEVPPPQPRPQDPQPPALPRLYQPRRRKNKLSRQTCLFLNEMIKQKLDRHGTLVGAGRYNDLMRFFQDYISLCDAFDEQHR